MNQKKIKKASLSLKRNVADVVYIARRIESLADQLQQRADRHLPEDGRVKLLSELMEDMTRKLILIQNDYQTLDVYFPKGNRNE